MKKLLLIFVFIVTLCLQGEEQKEATLLDKLKNATGQLRIADTIGHEPLVRTLVLFWAKNNSQIEINLEQITLGEALDPEFADKFDLIIYESMGSDNFALIPQNIGTCYALEVALVFVNSQNSLENISTISLSNMFCGEQTNWKMLNNNSAKVIYYGTLYPAVGERPFRLGLMGQLSYTEELISFASTPEVMTAVASNENAIGFGGFVETQNLSPLLRVLKIDGVFPTLENIYNKSYPLTLSRFASVVDSSENGELFVKLLTSQSAKKILKSELNMIPKEEL